MRRKGTSLLLDRLLSESGNSREVQQKIADALLSERPGSRSLVMKFVHRGRFHRIKLNKTPTPTIAKAVVSRLPKLPYGVFPSAFLNPKHTASSSRGGGGKSSRQEQFRAWWKENWPTLVLNFGSVATLVGFTRSDVLELRCLSVTGSMANITYQCSFTPIRQLAAGWSTIFALVNSVKIYDIIQERHQNVRMTPEQEDIYVKLLMPQ